MSLALLVILNDIVVESNVIEATALVVELCIAHNHKHRAVDNH